jgi:CHAD domain-containing protein
MPTQKIHLAIQQHYARVKALGSKVGETWGEEAIHRFRVEVKKLRSCLRLAGATRTGLKSRLPRKLHTFYSMTGVVRNLQLQRKGMAEAALRLDKPLPSPCMAVLEGRIQTAITMVKEYMEVNNPLGHARAEWQVAIRRHEEARGITRFLEERRDNLMSGVPFPDEAGLHAIRKVMKDILHVWPCFPDKETVLLLPDSWRSKGKLYSCTRRLGEFHDSCIKLQLLQDIHFISAMEDNAQSLLEELRQLWFHDREEKREQLRHLLLPGWAPGKETSFGLGNLRTESYELHVD